MPRVPIATENRTGEGGDRFPKIKPTDKGQKIRFTIIEVPWREHVHYLKAPTFENGVAVKETKKRRDGTEYEDYKLSFEGSPICLGDEAVLREKGLDEKNCPACAASVASGGDIPGPIQRFAVNVIEYALRGNTWDIKKPFSAEIKIWAFTGRTYDEIEGIQQEIGDLRKHDITLECEDPFWQRNKLGFKMEPGYTFGDKAYIRELLTTPGNKASDQQLKDACGRDIPRARMQDDCDHVLRQWRKLRVEGADGAAYDTGTGADLAGGIDDLLNEEGDETGAGLSQGNALTGGGEDPFEEFAEETTSSPSPEAAARQKAAASASGGGSSQPEPAATRKTAARPSKAEAAEPAPEEDPFAEMESGTAEAAPTPGAQAPAQKEEPADDDGDFDFDDLMEGVG